MAAVDFSNPQSWNRYAYVLNNPLSATDPLGLFCVWDDGSFDSNDDGQSGSSDSCGGLGGTWFNGSPSDWVDSSNNQVFGSGDWSNTQNMEAYSFAQAINPNGVADWGIDGSQNTAAGGVFSLLSGSAISISGWGPLIPIVVPIGGVLVPVGSIGAQGTVTYIPKTHTLCGKEISVTGYPSPDAAQTQNVVSNWGWSLSGQVSPAQGYSVLSNSSGTLWGYSAATSSGLQATYGYTGCVKF